MTTAESIEDTKTQSSQASDKQEIDATPLYTNPDQLEQVLYALTQPDNDGLRRATLLMRDFLSKPSAVMPLVAQIEKSKHAEVRQVAAVYLREEIEEYYKTLPDDIKPKLKDFLIVKLSTSQMRAERLAIAGAIASVGKFSFLHNEGWNELLMALDKMCQSDNKDLREVAFILWRNLIAYCGGTLKTHFGNILRILQKGLKDSQSTQIQVESVKGIGEMVEFLEHNQEVDIIANLVPDMVAVIDTCLKQADEDNVIAGMEVFNNLVECKIPVLYKHCAELTKFNLKIAAGKDELPMTVRKQATNFCTWMCKSKPKTVIKNNFVEPFITLCINLIIESQEMEKTLARQRKRETNNQLNEDEDSKDDEKTFLSPTAIACDLLDELFLNIPSEQCFPVSINAMEQLLKDKLPKRRKTGYVMMSMMAEGCKEMIARGDNLIQLLNACVQGTKDTDAIVRKCAFEAISQIATHLSIEILNHHQLVLSSCFKIFSNPNEEICVKERSLAAIEMFIDAYDPDEDDSKFQIEAYIPEIMNTIGKCLETNSLDLQQQAICTLTSCATAAKGKFVMYAPKILQILDSLLQIQEPEKLQLRAMATQCLGAVAVSIGREVFQPSFKKFHKYVLDGMVSITSHNAELTESTFMYFSDIAVLMGADLLKIETFDDMVNLVLFVVEDDDGLMIEMPDDGFGDAVPRSMIKAEQELDEENFKEEELKMQELEDMDPSQLEALINQVAAINEADADGLEEFAEVNENDPESDNPEDDMIGQLRSVKINVTTGFMEEKAAALHALTYFVKHCGFGFLKYMASVWEKAVYLWEYPHSLVKMAAANLYNEFFNLTVNFTLEQQEQQEQQNNNNNSAAANLIKKDGDNYMYDWRENRAEAEQMQYGEPVQLMIDTLFPLYIRALREEHEREPLGIVLEQFSQSLRILGPASVIPYMEELIDAIILFLNEKTCCQVSSDPQNEDTKDIATKHKFISDTVAELIAVLAELWHEKFSDIFAKIFMPLLKFGRNTRHPHDQAMAVGCIADCCSRLCDNTKQKRCTIMSPFSDTIYQFALRVAQSQDTNMRQNALYCMGAMFTVCDQSSNLQHSQTILRCVQQYMKFDRSGGHSIQLVRDNAVSALAKILISEPQVLPIKELLPQFLSGLPLTADFTENQYVYDVLRRLILNDIEIIRPYIKRALELCAFAVADDNVPQETTNDLEAMFQKICKDAQMQQIVHQLSPNAQQNILKCVAAQSS